MHRETVFASGKARVEVCTLSGVVKDALAYEATHGAFYTLVPIQPRSRGERRSLRTLPGASLRPPLGFDPRPRCLSTPPDAFQLHPNLR